MSMTTRTAATVLTTLALIASTVSLAYAGGAGPGGPNGEVFFQCYQVADGPNPPHQLRVNDQFINPTVENVGKLKLMCSFNPAVTVANQNEPGTSLTVVDAADHVMCYETGGAT